MDENLELDGSILPHDYERIFRLRPSTNRPMLSVFRKFSPRSIAIPVSLRHLCPRAVRLASPPHVVPA